MWVHEAWQSALPAQPSEGHRAFAIRGGKLGEDISHAERFGPQPFRKQRALNFDRAMRELNGRAGVQKHAQPRVTAP